LRGVLERVDASLLEEWERMLDPDAAADAEAKPAASRIHELARDPRMLRSRIRSELHMLVKTLAARDWEEAAACVRADVPEPWNEDRFEQALTPFFEQHERMLADARARQSQWTIIDAEGTQVFRVRQVLLVRRRKTPGIWKRASICGSGVTLRGRCSNW